MENQSVLFGPGSEDLGVSLASVDSILQLLPVIPTPHSLLGVDGLRNLWQSAAGRPAPMLWPVHAENRKGKLDHPQQQRDCYWQDRG